MFFCVFFLDLPANRVMSHVVVSYVLPVFIPINTAPIWAALLPDLVPDDIRFVRETPSLQDSKALR
jgi:hypothetical protein